MKALGAKGDGATDDSRAIQAAVDSFGDRGGTVRVPAGVYRIGSAVVIRHSGISILGDGPRSELKLADGVQSDVFVMPAPFGTNTSDLVVRNVRISDLTLDGNRNGGLLKPPTFFGIQIIHAEHVELSGLVMRDWAYDAISVGDGEKPNLDVTIRDSHFTGIGRNAIHFGYGSNLRVSDVVIEDTPSQQWGPAAGNAIDVEVEGQNSFVDGFVIQDSLMARTGTRTAGYGVALQPAFGPIRNGTITGNVIRNHQHGVFVGTAQGITVADNWVVADDNLATGAGITVYDGTAKVEDNVLNLLRWPVDFGYAGVLIHDPTSPLTVSGNRVWGGMCTIRLEGALQPVSVDGNVWGNPSGCFLDPGTPSGRVDASGNERRPTTALDQTPPSIRFAPLPAKPLRKPATVTAFASDTGDGVARVLFLVDGVPRGWVDRAPYTLAVDPSRYAPGTHTVQAFAVDKAANVSASVETAFRVAS